MDENERNHDAAPVELAAGWIAICATCGWVGETYGSQQKASADSDKHIEEAPSAESPLAFLADARPPDEGRPPGDSSPRAA